MSELIIAVKDRVPLTGDPIADPKRYRRGDVINVYEDGFVASRLGVEPAAERQHDFWRLLLLPNVPLALGKILMAAEARSDPGHPHANRALHTRMHSFNLAHPSFSPALVAYLADDTRRVPWFTEPSIGPAEFVKLFSRKPPAADPGVV